MSRQDDFSQSRAKFDPFYEFEAPQFCELADPDRCFDT